MASGHNAFYVPRSRTYVWDGLITQTPAVACALLNFANMVDVVSCHGYGDKLPTGDQSVFHSTDGS